jgi:hypothetical protein
MVSSAGLGKSVLRGLEWPAYECAELFRMR